VVEAVVAVVVVIETPVLREHQAVAVVEEEEQD
jgi:hypothetical protein